MNVYYEYRVCCDFLSDCCHLQMFGVARQAKCVESPRNNNCCLSTPHTTPTNTMHFLIIGDSPVSLLWSSILKLHHYTVSHLHSKSSFCSIIENQKGLLLKMDDSEKPKLCDFAIFSQFDKVMEFAKENALKNASENVAPKPKKMPPKHSTEKPPIDAILLFVSVAETQKRLLEMQPHLTSLLDRNVIFCCLQHGLGNVEVIIKHVPKNNLLFGSTVTHATSLRDGLIRGTSNRPTNVWSASGVISDTMKSIIKAFSDAGLPTTATPEAEIMLWKKMAVNCSVNVLSAICAIKIGSAWNDANNAGRDVMVQVAREVAQVAQLEGIKLTEQEAVDAVTFVAQKASNHVSDMCNDVLNQRTTSVEHLNGYILRCAQKHNLTVHSTQNLYNIVRLMEETYGKRLKPLVNSSPDEQDDMATS